jgi:hypothetical protein
MGARSRSSFVIRAGALALTLGLCASCRAGGPAGRPGTASSAPVSPSASAAPPAQQAACDSRPWRAAPVTVSHSVAVPPVPVLTRIRAAAHSGCGYDRLVLDISGKLPGYSIRYAGQVIADASGKVLSVPGASHLLITMRPSQAHQPSGQPAVSARIVTLGLPMLTAYAVAGDSEGVVTVAVGLRDTTAIRVGELPGRLYIDFRN